MPSMLVCSALERCGSVGHGAIRSSRAACQRGRCGLPESRALCLSLLGTSERLIDAIKSIRPVTLFFIRPCFFHEPPALRKELDLHQRFIRLSVACRDPVHSGRARGASESTV